MAAAAAPAAAVRLLHLPPSVRLSAVPLSRRWRAHGEWRTAGVSPLEPHLSLSLLISGRQGEVALPLREAPQTRANGPLPSLTHPPSSRLLLFLRRHSLPHSFAPRQVRSFRDDGSAAAAAATTAQRLPPRRREGRVCLATTGDRAAECFPRALEEWAASGSLVARRRRRRRRRERRWWSSRRAAQKSVGGVSTARRRERRPMGERSNAAEEASLRAQGRDAAGPPPPPSPPLRLLLPGRAPVSGRRGSRSCCCRCPLLMLSNRRAGGWSSGGGGLSSSMAAAAAVPLVVKSLFHSPLFFFSSSPRIVGEGGGRREGIPGQRGEGGGGGGKGRGGGGKKGGKGREGGWGERKPQTKRGGMEKSSRLAKQRSKPTEVARDSKTPLSDDRRTRNFSGARRGQTLHSGGGICANAGNDAEQNGQLLLRARQAPLGSVSSKQSAVVERRRVNASRRELSLSPKPPSFMRVSASEACPDGR